MALTLNLAAPFGSRSRKTLDSPRANFPISCDSPRRNLQDRLRKIVCRIAKMRRDAAIGDRCCVESDEYYMGLALQAAYHLIDNGLHSDCFIDVVVLAWFVGNRDGTIEDKERSIANPFAPFGTNFGSSSGGEESGGEESGY